MCTHTEGQHSGRQYELTQWWHHTMEQCKRKLIKGRGGTVANERQDDRIPGIAEGFTNICVNYCFQSNMPMYANPFLLTSAIYSREELNLLFALVLYLPSMIKCNCRCEWNVRRPGPYRALGSERIAASNARYFAYLTKGQLLTK